MGDWDELQPPDGLDENEMKRIQMEIDQSLQGYTEPIYTEPTPPPAANAAHLHEMPPLEPEAEANRGTDTPVAASPQPSYGQPTQPGFYMPYVAAATGGEAPAANDEPFYVNESQAAKSKRSRFTRGVAILCVVTLAVGSLVGFGAGYFAPRQSGPAAGVATMENPTANQAADEAGQDNTGAIFAFNDNARSVMASDVIDQGDWADINDKVEPSVVCITAMLPSESAFSDAQIVPSSLGSGIMFYEDESKVYIATNYHVVSGANKVGISVLGSELVEAKLIGREPQADLAVISITKAALTEAGVENIQVAAFGDSDDMRVGETVLAIGNALGEGIIATRGIISAKNKEINVEGRKLTVLQTDAAINPGNSGGPLVNRYGQVVGINTAKLSESSVEGMGYSITANSAKPIIEDIMNNKSKPFLGIEGKALTEEDANAYNFSALGVMVYRTIPGSAAEAAGIKRSDVITGINGQPVFTMDQLTQELSKCKVGDTVEVKILRDGKNYITVKATLTDFDSVDF